jgi:NADH-quinone oxidoreductase subunit M
MPLLAGFFLLLGLASLGLPGTSGFPAELLLIFGALEAHAGVGLAALFATILGAGYLLGIYRRAFLGPAIRPVVTESKDLRPRELAVALTLTLLVLAPGIYPAMVLDLTRASAAAWLAQVGAPAASAGAASSGTPPPAAGEDGRQTSERAIRGDRAGAGSG